MSVRRDVIRGCRISPILFLLVGCHDCSDTEEPPPSVAYLSVVPNELHVYIADPRAGAKANLIALVHDVYGRNLADHSTRFEVTTGAPQFRVAPLGVNTDSVALTIDAACAPSEPVCAAGPATAVITAKHAASGLEVPVTVHVRYEAQGDHGVAVTPPNSPWPTYGIGSGAVAGSWVRSVRPFVRRAGFTKFDNAPILLPEGDVEAASVLSHAFTLWRETSSWGPTTGDVVVPPAVAAKPSPLPIKAYYAGDPAFADATVGPMLRELEAGADIVNYTPAGVLATIATPIERTTNPIVWTRFCATLAASLATLPAGEQPRPGHVSVYMTAFSGTSSGSEFAMRCGPDKMPETGPMAGTHVIVLPYGSVMPSRFAHELGHVLALEDVSFYSGFFGDNLMMHTDALSAPMRSRLTIGQAFRAGLDPKSFVAGSRPAASGTFDCRTFPLRCPAVVEDVTVRVP